MKLSAAIRIGSMTTKQIKVIPHDGGNGRCALGAALEAINKCQEHTSFLEVFAYFPLSKNFVVHPVTHHPDTLLTVIWRLNDIHDWSREQIADWVETIEQAEEMQIVAQTEVLEHAS